MTTLELVLETPKELHSKANADAVLCVTDVCHGIEGLAWLPEVPIGGALVHAVRFDGYATTNSGMLDLAARFCAVLRMLPRALYLDGEAVQAVMSDGLARLVPVTASPEDDIEEARRHV